MKNLPKKENGDYAREFMANGNKYIILSPEEGIGIIRWSKLQLMSSVLGYGTDLASLEQGFTKLAQMFNGFVKGNNTIFEIATHINEMRAGMVEESRRNFSYVFWTACLFIIKEGEDMTKFVEAEQEAKIEDWNKEGINEQEILDLTKKKLIQFIQK
jgi:hypothetical protein